MYVESKEREGNNVSQQYEEGTNWYTSEWMEV